MMYENGCEFLRGEIEEDKLKLKLKFEEDIPYTDKWWKKKAVKRYRTLSEKNKIKPETLFYWDAIDISWEKMKEKYLKEVGR